MSNTLIISATLASILCVTQMNRLIRSGWINWGLPASNWVSPFIHMPKKYRVSWEFGGNMLRGITVLMSYTGNMAPFARISSVVMRKYCDVHKYRFVEKIDIPPTGRNRCWDKVMLIDRTMDSINMGDWIFWLDSDAVVDSMDKRLEAIIASADPSADLIICTSIPFTYNVNTGAMLIRKSPWSVHFVKHWWTDARERWKQSMCHEQSALDEMIARDKDCIRSLDRVCLFEYNEFNSTYQHNLNLRGKFVQHYRGCSTDKRREAMLSIAKSLGVSTRGM